MRQENKGTSSSSSKRRTGVRNPPRAAARTDKAPKRVEQDKPRNRLLSLPERPSRLLALVMLGVTIAAGFLAAPQVADPSTVPRPWSYLSDALCAVIAFGATSTLTTLAYCLAVFQDSKPVRKFLGWVAQNAGIGAVLGTLLGLRLAGPLQLAEKTGGPDITFVGFMGIVSNTATIFTLFMIATCWFRLAALVNEIRHEGVEPGKTTARRALTWAQTTGLGTVTLFLSNLAGYFASRGVWDMLQ